MGCDGGTIPTRDELVRLKKKPEQKDKDGERVAKWKHCAISQQALQSPIVACELGKLYNKDSVIEFLLDKSKFEQAANFEHIRGLKDIKELKLTDNPAYHGEKADIADGNRNQQAAQYICPISGLEMSGRHRFSYILSCGCVFSERAMKELKSETCTSCGKAYSKNDVIPINGTDEDVDVLTVAMHERRQKAKLAKKNKKKAAAAEWQEGESSEKKVKFDVPSTSSGATGTTGSHVQKVKGSKFVSGVGKQTLSKLPGGLLEEKKFKSVQKDPKASQAYKSLFTSSDACKQQPKGNWVTFNPCYY